jgi:TetR/AcrR family transcriptional regulator, regulator of cefoperazone and chloramphenicol sensitivity
VQNQDTPQRLLQAAIVEFAAKGLDNANLRDICARAEVNLNAVRYHFGGKEGLYIAAVEQANRTVIGEMQEPTVDETAPPEDRLRKFIGEMLEVSMSDRSRSTPEEMLMFREILEPTEATAQIARSHAKPMFDRLNALIAELLPAGAPRIEQHLLAISIIGQCMHFQFGQQMDRLVISPSEYRKFTVSRITDHILRVTLAAIRDYSDERD